MDNKGRFTTIRGAAKSGVAPENYLRMLEKQGRLPGVRSGNRFLVNTALLIEQLNRESLDNASGRDGAERAGDRV